MIAKKYEQSLLSLYQKKIDETPYSLTTLPDDFISKKSAEVIKKALTI